MGVRETLIQNREGDAGDFQVRKKLLDYNAEPWAKVGDGGSCSALYGGSSSRHK